MSFDSEIGSFYNESYKKTTPEIVSETFDLGQSLINTDYLPKIRAIVILKPYLAEFTSINLYRLGWRFQFHSSRVNVGLCVSGDLKYGESAVSKNIYISIEYTKHDDNWRENFKNVILHEISHAIIQTIFLNKRQELSVLDPENDSTSGHGAIFKLVCNAISNGDQCHAYYANSKLKDSFKKFKYTCTFCEHEGFGDSKYFSEECDACGSSITVESNLG